MRILAVAVLALAIALAPRGAVGDPTDTPATHRMPLEVGQWRIIERESGPDNYYALATDAAMPFIRAHYRPPQSTTVLGFRIDGDARSKARTVRWKWRAMTLPRGGNECVKDKADSAAVVYLTWKRALRYYSLKYVWSSVGPKGQTCDRKRNLFAAQDTIILESGGPAGVWQSEEINLKGDFRRHFENGKADADVPDFVGLGLMSDGDQTRSDSAADYAEFVIDW
jgi:hypothetical protein